MSFIKIYNWELKFKAGREKWRKVFQDVDYDGISEKEIHVCACMYVCVYVCVSMYLMMGINTTLLSLLLGVPPQYT